MTRPRSIRLTDDLDSALHAHAARTGQTLTDIIDTALRQYLGLDRLPGDHFAKVFADGFADLVERTYPPGSDYPTDATLRLFRAVADDPDLHGAWTAAVTAPDGRIDPHRKAKVNRRAGKAVKNLLDGTVIGRKDADPDDLIDSYSLLAAL